MSTRPTRSVFRVLRYAHALLGVVVVLFLGLILSNAFLFTIFRVDGHSMDPTLRDTQLLGISLASYWFASPRRDEIVIVEYSGDVHTRFVKRITGVPGDRVEYQGGMITLGEDEYFIVGDNRFHSTDSRVYGPIKRDRIIGKVVIR